MVLVSILKRVRADVKVMANWLLSGIEELRQLMIFVDPFNRTGAVYRNIGPLRDAMSWLETGGMLVVFPAGSHRFPAAAGHGSKVERQRRPNAKENQSLCAARVLSRLQRASLPDARTRSPVAAHDPAMSTIYPSWLPNSSRTARVFRNCFGTISNLGAKWRASTWIPGSAMSLMLSCSSASRTSIFEF